jgi:diketogulonate reductase-like aldo/keto reductase
VSSSRSTIRTSRGRHRRQPSQLAGRAGSSVNFRLPGDGRVDARFDDQLGAMVAARGEGLLAGVGLSNVSLGQLRENLAAEAATLDDQALRQLDGVGA